jgi:hypothetical protein
LDTGRGYAADASSDHGLNFSRAIDGVMRLLPLSDADKAEAVRHLLAADAAVSATSLTSRRRFPMKRSDPTPHAKKPEGDGKMRASIENGVRARMEHGYLMDAGAYEAQMQAVVGKDAPVLAVHPHLRLGPNGRVRPRDPIEELLVAQMVQQHARLTYLNVFAAQQANLKWGQMMHDAADRTVSTFRRQMLALAEYRRPAPPPAYRFYPRAGYVLSVIDRFAYPDLPGEARLVWQKELA